jgi:hypothetical protein
MELTEGAVRAIQDPVREAEKLTKAVTIVDTPDPRKKLLVQSGSYKEIVVPATFRKHQVSSLADLIAYGRRTGGVVWHSVCGVTLLLDDEDRRDSVQFALQCSDAWKQLKQMNDGGKSLTQKMFIRLLRLYLGASPATVNIFRRMDFQTQIKSGGEITKSKESLGRSIEAEVQGSSDLPEDLTVEVPIYENVGERQTYVVRLLLEYDAQNSQILVMPEPGLLTELEYSHQNDIHDRLEAGLLGDDESTKAAKPIAIYHGTP